MSTFQQNTTSTTNLNDGSQFKTTDYTKKTTLASENTDVSKPEFEYSRPAPTTLNTGAPQSGTTQPSTTESLKLKVSSIGHQIGDAVTNAGQQINQAITQKTGVAHPSSNTTASTQHHPTTDHSNIQSQQHSGGGFGSKLNDMMAHVGAALSHGHPVHAVTNANTAAKVGECERLKHEKGPLTEETGASDSTSLDNPKFNASGQPYENPSSTSLAGSNLTSQQQGGHSSYTTGDKIRDMTSQASAQLSHGHPIQAMSNAPAAARIGETEKLKHEKGPIVD